MTTGPPAGKRPETNTTIRTVFIVRSGQSGGGVVADREKIDDKTERIEWAFDKTTRDKIAAVRSKTRGRLLKVCLPFHGLMICGEESLPEVRKAVSEAGVALKEISDKLSAWAIEIPVPIELQSQSALERAIKDAINGFFLKTLNEKLVELAKLESVPERSRLSTLRLVEQMRGWNVLQDPDINKRLEDFRLQISAGIIKPLAEQVAREYEVAKSEGAFLEMEEVA